MCSLAKVRHFFDIGSSTRTAWVSVGYFSAKAIKFGAKDWCDCTGSDYSKMFACEYDVPPKPGYILMKWDNGYVRRWQVVPVAPLEPASCSASEADNTPSLWLQRCSSGLGSCWLGAGGVLGARPGPGDARNLNLIMIPEPCGAAAVAAAAAAGPPTGCAQVPCSAGKYGPAWNNVCTDCNPGVY
jgi:hypothetical protein